MKIYVMIIMIVLMVSGIAFAEEAVVQIDTDQTVYEEPQAEVEDALAQPKTPLEEYGDKALEPIEAVKDATNEFVNPGGMEFVYEADEDTEEYSAEGPKFKTTF